MNRRERARLQTEARIHRETMGEPPDSLLKTLVALFTEYGFARRILRKRLGMATQVDTDDRRVLEKVIFPYYRQDSAFKRLLFVGCDSYTANYERDHFMDVDFWTIEPNAALRKHGARQHIVAPLEKLVDYFLPRFFDLIVCNGVYGWGLNSAEQCEAAFRHCYDCLNPGGHLLIGWDDVPKHVPIPLSDIVSLRRFEQYSFPHFGSWRFLTDTPYRHTFDFYRRPLAG